MKEIIMMPVNRIKPYPNNPRINKEAVDKVAASISEFGWRQPLVLDADNVIIVGHTRLQAAKRLHMKEVPVLIADDLTEEQIKAYRLADNKTAEFAEWDIDKLREELDDIAEIDMESFGFDLSAFDDEPEMEVVDDEYEPEIPEEPVSKLGQIYQLGIHRLMCGDSTIADDVKKLMGGAQADLLITDPPYNVDYTGGTNMKIMNDKMENDKFRQFLIAAFSAADSVLKPGASFYIWHADTERMNFHGACNDVGWQVRECLIWVKECLVMGRQDYQWRHEPCLYGWKSGASHNWYSDRKQTTVLEFPKPKKSDLHPTMKPIPLFDYQIKNSTQKGDVVLDIFNGSGTTIMACEQNGRVAYGMELDPRYVDATIKRWEEFTGQKAVLLNPEE